MPLVHVYTQRFKEWHNIIAKLVMNHAHNANFTCFIIQALNLYLTFWEEHRLWVFENKVVTSIYVP
jgi:hypothetical protein